MPTLRVILDRFEQDRAIFLTQEGQQLIWNRDDLPEDVREGKVYFIHFSKDKSENVDYPTITEPTTNMKATETSITTEGETHPDKKHRKIAKAILEEILNGSS